MLTWQPQKNLQNDENNDILMADLMLVKSMMPASWLAMLRKQALFLVLMIIMIQIRMPLSLLL